MKTKRHLTRQEEFELMKLILDKFLWVGVGTLTYGFYLLSSGSQEVWYSLSFLAAGAILLFLFAGMLVREYHFMRTS